MPFKMNNDNKRRKNAASSGRSIEAKRRKKSDKRKEKLKRLGKYSSKAVRRYMSRNNLAFPIDSPSTDTVRRHYSCLLPGQQEWWEKRGNANRVERV